MANIGTGAKVTFAIAVAGGLIGLGIKCQQYRKAESEADLAALKTKSEANEQHRKQPPDVPVPKAPSGGTGPSTPPSQPVAPKAQRTLRDLLVAGSVWEGSADSTGFKMEVREVAGDTFTGRLHWSRGGKLVLTARMSGSFSGSEQVTFRWRKEDIEFGSGTSFLTATHTGTLYAEPDPEIRGRWAYQATSGSFRLYLVR
jgi:hypothetical protein